MVNDKAGHCHETAIREVIDKQFVKNDVQHDIFVRRRKGQSRREAARQALSAGFDTIVAVGGDGTVSRVADELVGSQATLGIIPTGTANLIARELRIPLDLDSAFAVLIADENRCEIDGMEIDGRRYFSHVSLGVYSRITKQESSAQKQRFGRAIYLWNLIRELRCERRWKFDLRIDGRRNTVRASMILAANIGATGLGDLNWGEQIRIDDGAIDLCFVRARTWSEYIDLIWKSLRRKTATSHQIGYDRARQKLAISSRADLPVRADGKLIGDRHVEMTIATRCVSVIVPPTKSPDHCIRSSRRTTDA